MLIKSSKTHDAFFSARINEITGKLNAQYGGVYAYFNLKETNRQLAAENARLRNQLLSNFAAPDSSRKVIADTTIKDTTNRFRKYIFLPATVVANTVTLENNFLTLERGTLQGVKKDMSVISPEGVVGTVIDVSDNYSRVMSILNRKSSVSAMLKKDNIAGSIDWDGKDPSYVTLKGIPKSAKVVKGDSVVTSNYSAKFPSQIMIGTVASISADPASNFYTLKIKTATNFYSIGYVNLVLNFRYSEQVALENKLKPNE
jgi:rod shape-determining protein MreC